MRLGQLARKIGVRPTLLVEHMAKENIDAESGSNSRLTDDLVIVLTKRFAPEKLDAIQRELLVQDEEVDVVEVNSYVEEKGVETEVEIETLIEEESNQTIESVTEPIQTQIQIDEPVTFFEEIIRAPKVELPGLKVLGKIEIFEPKKKEGENTVEVTEEVKPEQPVARPERKPASNRDRRDKRIDNRPRKNPITEQREREAYEAEKRKQERAKIEKEKRTIHYLKKVKTNVPVKQSRFVDEKVSEQKSNQEERPRTLWGRFKKWLRT